jgi:hypothetical protein
LLALNHFTVPCSFTDLFLLYYLGYLVLLEPPSAENKKGQRVVFGLAAPLNKSKGFTRATNAMES